MPDRDEFKKNVRYGWRSAAALALLYENHDDALRAALLALQRDLKCRPGEVNRGLPGFVEIVDVLQEWLPTAVRQWAENDLIGADERLDHIRRGGLCSATEEAVIAARRMLRDTSYSRLPIERDEIGARILAQIARGRLSPGVLLQELSHKRGISVPQYLGRLNAIVDQLNASPGTRRFASQLLADPSGALVTEIRRSKRPSQADLLVMSLTS